METATLRHASSETALPMRRCSARSCPAPIVGGAGSALERRNLALARDRLRAAARTTRRNTARSVDSRRHDDPGFRRSPTGELRTLLLTSSRSSAAFPGQAGNLQGPRRSKAANIFEGPRSSHYPEQAAAREPRRLHLRGSDAKKFGLSPFPQPSANASRAAYTNPRRRNDGTNASHCGFCERFGCVSPTPKRIAEREHPSGADGRIRNSTSARTPM